MVHPKLHPSKNCGQGAALLEAHGALKQADQGAVVAGQSVAGRRTRADTGPGVPAWLPEQWLV